MDEGFKVNDMAHLDAASEPGKEHHREANGWGLVREDLKKYGVHMLVNVGFIWDESTPPEMRKVFAEVNHVLHLIAENAIMTQLAHDGLSPTQSRDLLYGHTNTETMTLRDSGWHG